MIYVKKNNGRHVYEGELGADRIIGCICCAGYSEKDSKKFGFFTHYTAPRLKEHLFKIETISANNPIFVNSDRSAILVAGVIRERTKAYIDGEEAYENVLKTLIKNLTNRFPKTKIITKRYEPFGKIISNIDEGTWKIINCDTVEPPDTDESKFLSELVKYEETGIFLK